MSGVWVFQHAPHEHPGAIAGALGRRGHAFRTLEAWKPGAKFPKPSSVKALVVMGGPMGVYEQDKHPFLAEELRFLRAYLSLRRPVLGVCLGSQLLAAALGGEVKRNGRPEIGWYPLALTPEGRRDPLLSVFPTGSRVFQWHGDTFSVPAGADHLARSPLCRHQAIRFGRSAYGLQFHAEVTAEMVRDWLAQPGVERELAAFPRGHGKRILAGLPRHLPPLARQARRFLDGWCRLIPNN